MAQRQQDNNGAINLNDLAKMAKSNPQYATILGALAGIDNLIKGYVNDIVSNHDDYTKYYIKTELMSQCYALYLFSIERGATVATTWPLVEFLEMCQKKRIEYEVQAKVIKMLAKFDEREIDTDNINWIL